MQIGIDVGYNATKVVSGPRRAKFASAVGTPDRARFSLQNGDGGGIVLMEPFRALVGEEAVTQSRFLNRWEDRNWIQSDDWLALFLAAITEVTAATSVDLSIVTGLPVSFYDDKSTVERRLLGEHRVQREGQRAQQVTVRDVRVIPQPFGTLLSEILDDRGRIVEETLAKAHVGIIDVGGKTCNLLSVEGLKQIEPETTSVDIGGWDLVRAVRDWLARDYPGLDELRDHKLAGAIQAGSLNYYGEPVPDFSQVVDDIAGDLAQQIVSEASRRWGGGATLDAILVTGGGAYLLGQQIGQQWPHARLVENPVYANASGYWKFARRFSITQ